LATSAASSLRPEFQIRRPRPPSTSPLSAATSRPPFSAQPEICISANQIEFSLLYLSFFRTFDTQEHFKDLLKFLSGKIYFFPPGNARVNGLMDNLTVA